MHSFIKKTIVLSIMAISCISKSLAHQPDVSSTMIAENEQGEWILQIRAALTAFEYEVHYKYGETSYTTPEEFQELVIKLVKDNFIAIGGENISIELTSGQVRLGHETSVYFQLQNMSDIKDRLTVTNTTFANINRNQTALIFAVYGAKPIQHKLDNKNKHSTTIRRNNQVWNFEDSQSEDLNSSRYLSYAIGGLSIILVSFLCVFLFRKRKM